MVPRRGQFTGPWQPWVSGNRCLARARDATDFRPSINGVGGACASRRTVWGSGRERWRDGAGWLPDLKISAPSVVACILAWARDATDFRTIDERGRRCLREPAHGVREWPRAVVRRGRLLPDLSISAHTPQHVPDACSHRMQLSSLHPDEAPGQTVRRTSKAGFRRLHVHAEHVPHAMQSKHQTCTSTLSSDSRPVASRGEENLGEVVPNTAHQMNARAV